MAGGIEQRGLLVDARRLSPTREIDVSFEGAKLNADVPVDIDKTRVARRKLFWKVIASGSLSSVRFVVAAFAFFGEVFCMRRLVCFTSFCNMECSRGIVRVYGGVNEIVAIE